MFTSRRNSYSKNRRWRSSSQTSRQKPLIILLSIPLILILLELLVRLLVGVAGKNAELAAYEGESAIITAYNLKFLSPSQQPYQGLPDQGSLAAQRSLAGGYSLMGKQESNFWSINEQGFRDDQPVPLAKPENEIRIFLLGGSTAFGQWNASNQATFASKLEKRLNERVAQQKRSPEKYRPLTSPYFKSELDKALTLPPRIQEGQYRVINAAVPGYASGNEIAQLALQVLPYSPDMILVLDGYTDLMLPSQNVATDIPKSEAFLNNAPGHFWTYLEQQLDEAIADTYLVKATQYWILRPQPSVSRLSLVATEETIPLAKRLAADEEELNRRAARYRQHIKQIIRLTTGANIPLIVAVQPEITGRSTSQIDPREQEMLSELGSDYRERVQRGYAALETSRQQLQKAYPNNVKTLNFYDLYEDFPERAFYDAVHLTEAGHSVLAERFYQAIAAVPKLQVSFLKPE
jgi:lysophospholipase L1-like esterase